ncbi:unnamed protein product [Moneuplotes crassus]|uniref:Uncharacterized protein n=1 Tax=Euplotes crassus TaxID=5936 RepID=A0AAD1X7C0_EUPCR|nr:unnamed protein product [Moneuplotes crassus]
MTMNSLDFEIVHSELLVCKTSTPEKHRFSIFELTGRFLSCIFMNILKLNPLCRFQF